MFFSYSSLLIPILGLISGSYIFLPLLPPYANVLAIPIAPIASSLSASCTHFPSIVLGTTESVPANETSSMILHTMLIISASTPFAVIKSTAFFLVACVSGESFLSSTSCSRAANWTILTSAYSCFAISVAILYTLTVW